MIVIFMRHIREDGRLEGGLDHSSVDGEDGTDDTGEEDERQLVHVPHSYKHHQGHEAQHQCAVNTHVVQHGGLGLGSLQTLHLKDRPLWNNVHLR